MKIVVKKSKPGFLWDWQWAIYKDGRSYAEKQGSVLFGKNRAIRKAMKKLPISVTIETQ